MNRREFLKFGLATTGALVLPGCGGNNYEVGDHVNLVRGRVRVAITTGHTRDTTCRGLTQTDVLKITGIGSTKEGSQSDQDRIVLGVESQNCKGQVFEDQVRPAQETK